jgi:hypothetical protein
MGWISLIEVFSDLGLGDICIAFTTWASLILKISSEACSTCVGFGTICHFRHLLGVLKWTPSDTGGYCTQEKRNYSTWTFNLQHFLWQLASSWAQYVFILNNTPCPYSTHGLLCTMETPSNNQLLKCSVNTVQGNEKSARSSGLWTMVQQVHSQQRLQDAFVV